MKIIKYNLSVRVNAGTPDDPEYVELLSAVEMPWSEDNETIAKTEAHNGKYTIEDDGTPEPASEPTAEDRIEALEAALLEMMGVSAYG